MRKVNAQEGIQDRGLRYGCRCRRWQECQVSHVLRRCSAALREGMSIIVPDKVVVGSRSRGRKVEGQRSKVLLLLFVIAVVVVEVVVVGGGEGK